MDLCMHDLKDDRYDSLIKDYVGYVEKGLPVVDAPKKDILIIGAGCAGLSAGMLLRERGHRVRIFEASQRVGGRVKTFRDEFTGDNYAEAGAMRLPSHHLLLMAWLRHMKMPLRPFYNVSIDAKTRDKGQAATRTFNTYVRINGIQLRLHEYLRQKNAAFGFPLSDEESQKTVQDLIDDAIAPLIKRIADDPERGWQSVIDEFGEYSVRRFFKEQTSYSEGAIELIGLIANLESRMMTSFIQSFIELSNINFNVRFWEIPGGSDRFTSAFLPVLQDCISFTKRMSKLEWDPEGKKGITVHFEDGDSETGDEVIVTIPFSALRFVQVSPLFSHNKQRAIRELHYDSSTKVLLEFSRRFWEKDDNIYGGGHITDLPSRFIYFPGDKMGTDEGGVVLASYTWADDAIRWDSLTPEQRYRDALDSLALIHGDHIRQYYVGGATQSWVQDQYAMGEAAIFAPGQLELLHKHIATPEGKVHFAGEHTSLKHAWIEGALESGMRAAMEANGNL